MTPKLETYRRKLQTSLAARFYLRFHVSLILAFAILCGWIGDLVLLKAGVSRMIVRYPLAVLCAYAGFLAGVRVWIGYSGISEYVSRMKRDELVGEDVKPAPDKVGPDITWLDVPTIDFEGCAVVIAVAIGSIIVFYFLGGYLFANAAAFFSEIVLELLLAAGLLRGIDRIEASGWMLGTMRATYWSLVFSLVVAVLFGWWAQTYYPEATTMKHIITK